MSRAKSPFRTAPSVPLVLLLPLLLLALLAAAFLRPTAAGAASAGPRYVALGSSFAAGPGIPPAKTGIGDAVCTRSGNNYASQVARTWGLDLADATCGGATTADVLTRSQAGQPPQIEAVTADARLVTVTIGGNDVNYLGSLGTYSCQTSGTSTSCGTVDRNAVNQNLDRVSGLIKDVVDAVHARAPQARVLLVNYQTILPAAGGGPGAWPCPGVPLTDDQLAFERGVADRLAAATATAANTAGATLIDIAAESRGHDACAGDPWIEGYTVAAGRVGYHPNEAGMTAIAGLIGTELARTG
ncbi:SGNH/GDSL hydrolase family protein [Streptomyces sp. NBC_01429]|uniref:SGNH/GDSL hydrolase family protein n=1 Tax=Streptomyces sp. NBC_01429 TaxID=2903862 RepID=UPI002E2D3AA1|nr:SGNH/GDSL hydrolase family protein [Streptomyces sp. NBC_01429]